MQKKLFLENKKDSTLTNQKGKNNFCQTKYSKSPTFGKLQVKMQKI